MRSGLGWIEYASGGRKNGPHYESANYRTKNPTKVFKSPSRKGKQLESLYSI
jgi:hypothetical protein